MLSIIIPTCQRTDTLASCLRCLEPGAQSAPGDSYEVVVTDDGGHSTAREMISGRFPWARWTRGPRRGPAANRNHGAGLAVSEWIAFCDDDCLPGPDWVEAMRTASGAGDADVIEGRTICKAGLPGPGWHSPINETGGFLWSCNFAIRRGLFEDVGGFDERFPLPHMEDCDLRERLRSAGAVIKFCPEAVVDHPPRRLPSVWRLARTHESEIFFNRIHLGQPGFVRVFWGVLKTRLRPVIKSRAFFRAGGMLASAALEMAVMAALMPVWIMRHRRPARPWNRQMRESHLAECF